MEVKVVREIKVIHTFDSVKGRFVRSDFVPVKDSKPLFIDTTDPIENVKLDGCPEEISAHAADVKENKSEIYDELFGDDGLPAISIEQPKSPTRAGERGPRGASGNGEEEVEEPSDLE